MKDDVIYIKITSTQSSSGFLHPFKKASIFGKRICLEIMNTTLTIMVTSKQRRRKIGLDKSV